MNLTFYLKLYFATLSVFFAIDMLWLGLIARSFYRKHIGFIMAPSPNWTAAIIFYLIFVAGLIFFAVTPGLQANSIGKTVFLGALYGFITYATYDLTNLATLKNWPVFLSLVDILWGTILAILVSGASFYIGQWLR